MTLLSVLSKRQNPPEKIYGGTKKGRGILFLMVLADMMRLDTYSETLWKLQRLPGCSCTSHISPCACSLIPWGGDLPLYFSGIDNWAGGIYLLMDPLSWLLLIALVGMHCLYRMPLVRSIQVETTTIRWCQRMRSGVCKAISSFDRRFPVVQASNVAYSPSWD